MIENDILEFMYLDPVINTGIRWATTLFYSGWYLVDLEIFVHSHALATDVQSGLSPKAL